ncbi:MAG: 4'-phosphopantetheinyl transferase superfamily protein [Clostridiales bacterium]|jgi:4'-phosphopantetheinyl transferase|nr:4'-phosphopantetheinyl transferase superfamily protein [Clostridiales bacterium]
MVSVIAADVTPLLDESAFAERLRALSQVRQLRAGRYRFPKDRALSLGVGLLCDVYLSRLGLRERTSGFTYDAKGAPRFAALPRIRVSLSHSGSVAAAAFCESGKVGIDVERVKPLTDAEFDIAARCFTAEEARALLAREAERQSAMFFRLWTEKESLFKYNSETAARFFGFHKLFPGYAMTVCAAKESIVAEPDIALF